nr:phosphonate C-P lyase system protein PhnH [uncultured Vibrio sp.]
MSTSTLISGFENPVLDSLNNFRKLADVIARPGSVAELPQLIGPQGVYKTSFSFLLTLLDTKSSLYLSEEYRIDSVTKNVAFHCNCSCDVSADKADFALMNGANPIDFNQFNAGSARDPHQSTSLIIEIDKIASTKEESLETKLVLSGPGIQTEHAVSLKGLHSSFVDYLTHRTHAFPTGLDMFLMTEDKVMAIPRTTHVKIAEAETCM